MEHPVSMVESEREEELRLAAEAHAAATALAEKQFKNERRKKLLKKTILIVSLALIGIALVVSIIWLIISLVSNFSSSSSGDQPGDKDKEDPDTSDLASIEGYKCTSTNCAKVIDLDDHRILVRDNSAYFIHDRAKNSSVRTTIQEQNYREILPFTWGDELLAVLHPDTGRSAAYSVTRNRQIGSFSYDGFLTDASAKEYANMQWVIGKYLLATQGSEVRLLDVFDGKEVVRATSKIFAYKPFFFGHETTLERRVYIDTATRILSTVSGDFLAIKEDHLIHVKGKTKTSMDIYDQNGSKLKSSDTFHKDLLKRLRDAKSKDYAATLTTFQDVFVVPN